LKKTILVVDDDEDIRFMIKSILMDDFEILESEETVEATSLKDKADLIITDILMPGSTGLELIKEIRSESNAPIIVLSGAAVPPEMAIEYGADLYIEKPFQPEELLEYVNNLIEKFEKR
jgi:DNA-binding response OmpR family regulator